MISDDRKEELQFLIRNKIPIRMTDIDNTELQGIDISDFYTLCDLCEAGVVELGLALPAPEGYTVATTFYETISISNDEGTVMDILAMETINIAIEQKTYDTLTNFL
jgi:hypothetical protein